MLSSQADAEGSGRNRPTHRRRAIWATLAVLALIVTTAALTGYAAHVLRPHVAGPAVTASDVSTPVSGLPAVSLSDLPSQARQTVTRIDSGGPFPYRKDGSVFSNIEGLLPQRSRGYYREYTVRTPGASDRGARRIVAGQDGDLYYTSDHYASFHQIMR